MYDLRMQHTTMQPLNRKLPARTTAPDKEAQFTAFVASHKCALCTQPFDTTTWNTRHITAAPHHADICYHAACCPICNTLSPAAIGYDDTGHFGIITAPAEDIRPGARRAIWLSQHTYPTAPAALAAANEQLALSTTIKESTK